MKAVVAAFNQEKALVGAFSVITNLRMELFEALVPVVPAAAMQQRPSCTADTLTLPPTQPGLSQHTFWKASLAEPGTA